jgi:hypothetical protein
MPGIAEEVVQPCRAIMQLDEHINSDAERKASYSSALNEGGSPAFVAGGPLDGMEDVQANWGTDWVDATGHGGAYWPYATDVDLSSMIKGALTESVTTATETGKIHQTLWITPTDPPDEHAAGRPVPTAKQESLFKVAVHETERVVTLVILTPQPLQAS